VSSLRSIAPEVVAGTRVGGRSPICRSCERTIEQLGHSVQAVIVSQPSILIVGAGVAGLSAALHAVELGSEVTVLERDHVASGSSGLSVGVYNVNATDSLNVAIRVNSRNLLDRFEREDGLHLARIGHLRLARAERHVELFEATIDQQKDLGVAEASRLLRNDEILDIVPDLRIDDVVGGLYNARDGHMDGPLLCGLLAERAQSLGARLILKSQVVRATKASGKHVISTAEESFEADVVINAAGPWAQRIGDLLGAPLPLVNQVHDVIKVRLPEGFSYVVPMVQEYIPGYEEAIYFRQDGPDSMICGEHTYAILDKLGSEEPDGYRKTVPFEIWEGVARRVSSRFPVEGLGFQPGWTGLYPISADGQFIVGPYEHDASIIAFGGLGGSGVTSGLGLGPVAAEWAIFGEPRTIPGVAELLPDRPSLHKHATT
jgi:sarcosine oxidase subunit beta